MLMMAVLLVLGAVLLVGLAVRASPTPVICQYNDHSRFYLVGVTTAVLPFIPPDPR
jgi:hypothetical protein